MSQVYEKKKWYVWEASFNDIGGFTDIDDNI